MAVADFKAPDFDSRDLKELKEKLVNAAHILDREGITEGFGHVSVRLPNGEGFLTLAVVGSSIEQAILRTVQLSFLGELAHRAVAHGEPLYLIQEELATFSADQAFPARPWEYYLSRIGAGRST